MKVTTSFRLKPTDKELLELIKSGADEKTVARRLGIPLKHVKKKVRKLKILNLL